MIYFWKCDDKRILNMICVRQGLRKYKYKDKDKDKDKDKCKDKYNNLSDNIWHYSWVFCFEWTCFCHWPTLLFDIGVWDVIIHVSFSDHSQDKGMPASNVSLQLSFLFKRNVTSQMGLSAASQKKEKNHWHFFYFPSENNWNPMDFFRIWFY